MTDFLENYVINLDIGDKVKSGISDAYTQIDRSSRQIVKQIAPIKEAVRPFIAPQTKGNLSQKYKMELQGARLDIIKLTAENNFRKIQIAKITSNLMQSKFEIKLLKKEIFELKQKNSFLQMNVRRMQIQINRLNLALRTKETSKVSQRIQIPKKSSRSGITLQNTTAPTPGNTYIENQPLPPPTLTSNYEMTGAEGMIDFLKNNQRIQY